MTINYLGNNYACHFTYTSGRRSYLGLAETKEYSTSCVAYSVPGEL